MRFLEIVQVLYDYAAENESEMSIKENELLILIDQSDSSWWEAYNYKTERQGLIPSNYVQVADHLFVAKCLYTYAKTNSDELSFEENSNVLVYDQNSDSNWWLCKLDDKIGFAPSNYLSKNTVEGPQKDSGNIFKKSFSHNEADLVAAMTAKTTTNDVKTDLGLSIVFFNTTEIDSKKKKRPGLLTVTNKEIMLLSSKERDVLRKILLSDVKEYSEDKDGIKVVLKDNSTISYLITGIDKKGVIERLDLFFKKDTPAKPPNSTEKTMEKSKMPALVKSMSFTSEGVPKIAIAMYDFDTTNAEELSMKVNENFIILDETDPDWILVKSISKKKGQGLVPRSYLQFKEPKIMEGDAQKPATNLANQINVQPHVKFKETVEIEKPKRPVDKPPISLPTEPKISNENKVTLPKKKVEEIVMPIPKDENSNGISAIPSSLTKKTEPLVDKKPNITTKEETKETSDSKAPDRKVSVSERASEIASKLQALEIENKGQFKDRKEASPVLSRASSFQQKKAPEIPIKPLELKRTSSINSISAAKPESPKPELPARPKSVISTLTDSAPEKPKRTSLKKEDPAPPALPPRNSSVDNLKAPVQSTPSVTNPGSSVAEGKTLPLRPDRASSMNKPMPSNTRMWTDATGSFKVEGEFLGLFENKVHIHKLNGVKIAVPIEKLCADDIKFIENALGKKLTTNNKTEEVRKVEAKAAANQATNVASSKKEPTEFNGFNWFTFFINSVIVGINHEDAYKYAVKFVQEKMDGTIVQDLTREILKDLSVAEGDIIRIKKAIQTEAEKNKKDDRRKAGPATVEPVKDMTMVTQKTNTNFSSPASFNNSPMITPNFSPALNPSAMAVPVMNFTSSQSSNAMQSQSYSKANSIPSNNQIPMQSNYSSSSSYNATPNTAWTSFSSNNQSPNPNMVNYTSSNPNSQYLSGMNANASSASKTATSMPIALSTSNGLNSASFLPPPPKSTAPSRADVRTNLSSNNPNMLNMMGMSTFPNTQLPYNSGQNNNVNSQFRPMMNQPQYPAMQTTNNSADKYSIFKGIDPNEPSIFTKNNSSQPNQQNTTSSSNANQFPW